MPWCCCGKEGCHLVACLLVFFWMTNMTGDSAQVTMSLSLLTMKISTKPIHLLEFRKRRWFLQELAPQLQYSSPIDTAVRWCSTARCWQLARRGTRIGSMFPRTVVPTCFGIWIQNYFLPCWITRFGPPRFSEAHLPMNGGTRRPCWACRCLGDGKGQGNVPQQEFPLGTFKPEISWCVRQPPRFERKSRHTEPCRSSWAVAVDCSRRDAEKIGELNLICFS